MESCTILTRDDGLSSQQLREQRQAGLGEVRGAVAGQISQMTFPDLAPWFDNASDGYDELPAEEIETSYDE